MLKNQKASAKKKKKEPNGNFRTKYNNQNEKLGE
jgi:hypothetical protein